MYTIDELKEELETGDYGAELLNYSGSTYICDAITEAADSNTSIYYSDIMEYIKENPEAVNDAVSEMGWPGDIYKAGQQAEFISIERDIYDNLTDSIKLYALDYIGDTYGKEIDPEKWEEIEAALESIDSSNRMEDITEAVKAIMEPEEKEETTIAEATAEIIKAAADLIATAPAPALVTA